MRQNNVVRKVVAAIDGMLPGGGGAPAHLQRESSGLERVLSMHSPGVLVEGYLHRRDLTITGDGSSLVGTKLEEVLAAPRTQSLIEQLGIEVRELKPGDHFYPSMDTSATATWGSEVDAVGESQPSVGGSKLSPKIIGNFFDVSVKFWASVTQQAREALIGDSLVSIEEEICRAILHGAGGKEPTGIAGTSGVHTTVDGAGFNFDAAADMEGLVTASKFFGTQMAFVTTPTVRTALRKREKVVGQASFLVDDNNRMLGLDVAASSVVAANNIFIGNWDHVKLLDWGITDVVVNPYTFSLNGMVRIVLRRFVDVLVRRPAAFVLVDDFS